MEDGARGIGLLAQVIQEAVQLVRFNAIGFPLLAGIVGVCFGEMAGGKMFLCSKMLQELCRG